MSATGRPGESARSVASLIVCVAVTTLVLGACRGAAPVAAPPLPTTGATSGGSGAPDPLAGVESAVDAVDREIDADAGYAGR